MASFAAFSFLQIIIYFAIFSCSLATFTSDNNNYELNEDNWRQILEGEWMIEFYAPWCPACSAIAPAWRELGERAKDEGLSMRAGAVDVTLSPGLSGRFVVTALPTIFHVKDSVFRQYKGPRDAESMLSFVVQQRWKQTDPIPGWKAPHSLQMTFVAELFKLSQALRSVHTMLMETYGLPTWGSYLIFAIGTILIGAVLGLILVFIIDFLYPPSRKVLVTQAEMDKARNAKEEEIAQEDLVDDSEAEKHSPSDSSEEDKQPEENKQPEVKESAGDAKEDKPEVRKRRPRKAD